MSDKKIKAVFCDVDGTLTDGTVYYSDEGEEFKQFSHRDGRAFHLLREATNGKTKVFLITSEAGGINRARIEKFVGLGTIEGGLCTSHKEKSTYLEEYCRETRVLLSEVLYIGDDTNDLEAMRICGFKACPADAHYKILSMRDVHSSDYLGGRGAVRDIIEFYMQSDMFYGQGGES